MSNHRREGITVLVICQQSLSSRGSYHELVRLISRETSRSKAALSISVSNQPACDTAMRSRAARVAPDDSPHRGRNRGGHFGRCHGSVRWHTCRRLRSCSHPPSKVSAVQRSEHDGYLSLCFSIEDFTGPDVTRRSLALDRLPFHPELDPATIRDSFGDR